MKKLFIAVNLATSDQREQLILAEDMDSALRSACIWFGHPICYKTYRSCVSYSTGDIAIVAEQISTRMYHVERHMETMDIPAKRKDLKRPENVRWLLRNIKIKNADHPSIDYVIERLKFYNKLHNYKLKEVN